MSKILVGTSTPLSDKTAEAELRIGEEASDLFDILCSAKIPDAKYPAAWKATPLSYGIYVEAGIPFFLVDLPKENKTYSLPVNVYASKQAQDWLKGKGVAVHLFLVNMANNIIQAQRTFSSDSKVADELKKQCQTQITQYKTADEVQAAITRIRGQKSAKLMATGVKMVTLLQV